jgi:predicted ATPase/class 3 adenylate cyclase
MGNMAATGSTHFGDLLRRHRLAAGLTQEELAERAGLSRRGIADLERGVRQSPRKETAALLAEALGLAGEDRTVFAAAARRTTRRAEPAASAASPLSAVPDGATSSAPALPSGTVTFLFTDIEGSTHLLQQLGSERYAALCAEHQQVVRAGCAAHGGREVDTQGDGFFFAFPTATSAVTAAAQVQQTLVAQLWPDGTPVQVRMGLHTGTPLVTQGGGYVGLDVVRAARIAAAGHGGQVLLSAATRGLTEQALPEGASLRDLGEHRLKDLLQPERIAQLLLPGLPADFPPLRSLDRHAQNLPIQPTPLLGRETAVATLTTMLRRDDVRLVTLSGPGGVGKTRLGLQVAAELSETFADGVWFIRLSRLTDPALVLPTIAQTLGLRELGSQSSEAMLRDYVHTRQVLLLLDNFEQVVAAAPQVAELLATSPGLRLLVTSRVVLRLQGEHEYPVPPLALPPASPSGVDRGHGPSWDQVTTSPAVALFVEQARAHRPDFALSEATAPAVAAICARLDGLPLALGLAAARVKLLPPPALLQRLERRLPLLAGGARDLEARQQTMRATLVWSEDLLQPEERRLFCRLAVFVGGFTLEAAEAVCAAPEGAAPLGLDVLDGLGALVDQSLVWQREETDGMARYGMLQVIREYAVDQLEASGEAEALRQAHATYSLALAEAVEPWLLSGPRLPEGLARLEREHDNLRAALAWTRRERQVALGLRLAGSLGHFWNVQGYRTEGRGWLEELLALSPQAPGAADISAAQAKALVWASNFAWRQRDDERAQAAAEEALALARGQQAETEAGMTLNMLGLIAWDQGDLERATAYLEESVARLRATGEPGLAAAYVTTVGAIALERGDLERATACCKESLAFARRTGDDYAAGHALAGLADVARQRGDLTDAEQLGREELQAWRRLGVRGYVATCLERLAYTAAAGREVTRAERAARLLGAAAALRKWVSEPLRRRQWQAGIERGTALAQQVLGEEAWAAAYAAGQAMTLEEAVAAALEETQGR